MKPKEAEKLSSNVQTASGTKHEDDSTIRFGVGLGIRKRSEVSTSVDGAPLKVVGSLSKLLLCTPDTSTTRDYSEYVK